MSHNTINQYSSLKKKKEWKIQILHCENINIFIRYVRIIYNSIGRYV